MEAGQEQDDGLVTRGDRGGWDGGCFEMPRRVEWRSSSRECESSGAGSQGSA